MRCRQFTDPAIIAGLGLAVLVAGVPATAQAYVGPGAGLSLVAAFWAVLVAIGTVVVFTLTWPVRRLMRRRRGDAEADRTRSARRS